LVLLFMIVDIAFHRKLGITLQTTRLDLSNNYST